MTGRGGAGIEQRSAGDGMPEIEIRATTRRKKTATAWWQGSTLIIAMPARVRGEEREKLITWLVERSKKRRPHVAASDRDLLERAQGLTALYGIDAEPASIRFVSNQTKRWGSCTAATASIRISDRLRHVPDWVLDAVLVHELAHLVHPDHSAAFHSLADRYPRQAEASLFLEGYQLGLQMSSDRIDDEEDQRGLEGLEVFD